MGKVMEKKNIVRDFCESQKECENCIFGKSDDEWCNEHNIWSLRGGELLDSIVARIKSEVI